MEYISIIVLTLCVFFNIIISKNIISLAGFFSFFWLVICFFSMFHFYGLYEISDYVYFLVILGNLGILLGNLSLSIVQKNNKKNIVFTELRKKLFIFCLLVAIFIALCKIYLMLPTILNYGIGEARNLMQQEQELNLSGSMKILQLYFAFPFIRAAIIILLIRYIFVKKYRILLVVIILSLITYLADGGRSSIIYSVISLICVIIFYYERISKKEKKILFYISISLFCVILYATAERKVDILNNIYTYYCGSLAYFSENINNPYLFSKLLYGVNSFQGFFRPLYGILNLIGIQDPSFLGEANNFLIGVQDTISYVSPTIKMNYFITIYGYFYKDLGCIGVFLYSFILGGVFAKVNRYSTNNMRGIALKILFFQGIMFTMSMFFLGSYNFVMALVYIVLMTKKIKKS